MIPQSKAKLFLADERGLNQLDWYRSFNTFNFGNYQHEHKAPFSNLYVLNDDTLAGGKSIGMTVEQDIQLILIPVVGAVEYEDSRGAKAIIKAGQIQVLPLLENSSFKISNPYEDELVNFLQLWIKSPVKTDPAGQHTINFDLLQNKNRLINFFKGENAIGYIGQFDGRAEAILPISRPGNTLFAFVIDGQFEVQYRLMQARDGLVVWDIDEVEMEALSNGAIILILELPVE